MRDRLNRRELLIGGATVAGTTLLPSAAPAAPAQPLALVASQFEGLHVLIGRALSMRGFAVLTTFDPSLLPRLAGHLDFAVFDLAHPDEKNARHVVEARRRGMRKPVFLTRTWLIELYGLDEFGLGDQAVLPLPASGRVIMAAVAATIERTHHRA